jgi:hypothetical protein
MLSIRVLLVFKIQDDGQSLETPVIQNVKVQYSKMKLIL